MFLAAGVVSGLLAALLAYSAVRKLTHDAQVVRTYTRVGVPEDKLDYLAGILLAGVAGLVLGFFWSPIGVAAAIGLIVYFSLAVVAHVRAGDAEHLPTPIVLVVLASASLILRLATS
ncbi:MAG: DoxX family protein [Jiangellaceae bacterium]